MVAHQITVPEAPAPGAPGLTCMADGRGAVLSGRWPAIPAHQTAGLLLVATAIGHRAVVVLCDDRLPGYHAEHLRHGMGSVALVDLVWDGCRVGPERLLEAGEAALVWQAHQQVTQLGAGAVGAAARCLEMGLDYARRRQTFGRPLADRQAIQWMLADSARELHAARLLLYRVASLADAGDVEAALRLAGPAKAYATDAACRIADRMLQLHGGYGYTRDLPLERIWRELRFYRLAEGRNEDLVAASTPSLLAALDA
jgi:acyl-CoA dehydrogenase